jgi:CBS domain-containing membrane protein
MKMTGERLKEGRKPLSDLDMTDQDILEAMKSIPGYLDITPADFKEVYLHAYQQAVERLSRSVMARDIMTENVVRVKPDTDIAGVAEVMAEKGVSGVPVVDDETRVLGIISEKNFLSRLSEGGPKNVMSVIARCLQAKKCLAGPLRGQTARDLMSSPPICLSPETTLEEISRLFSERQINRAPVVNAQNRLLGIVSRGDIIQANRWGINQ